MSFRIPGILSHSLRTPLILGSGIGVSAALYTLRSQRRPLLLDSSPSAASPRDWSFSQYQNDASVPVTSRGRMNPKAIRQLSAGSIIGMPFQIVAPRAMLTYLLRRVGSRTRCICLLQVTRASHRSPHRWCTDGRELRSSSDSLPEAAGLCQGYRSAECSSGQCCIQD